MIETVYESVQDFVDEVKGDDRMTYSCDELADLAASVRRSRGVLRTELEGHGLTLAERPKERRVRGFADRSSIYSGPGAMPMHGGSGQAAINGFATYDGYGSQREGTDFGRSAKGHGACACHRRAS